MKEKTFWRWLILICVVGILSLIGILCYTFYLHDNVSIIAYIANERS